MYIYIYIYIYVYIYIYICIFIYFYIGQRIVKEVNFANIKNCLNLVVKVESFKSITIRQNICHYSYTIIKCIQVILIVL